jgi:hypothetical protein
MQFESHLGHSVSAGQRLFCRLVLTNLDVDQAWRYLGLCLGAIDRHEGIGARVCPGFFDSGEHTFDYDDRRSVTTECRADQQRYPKLVGSFNGEGFEE